MLSRWERTITDEAGNRIDQPQVKVQRERVGAPLAALKADIDGASSLDNPFIPAPGVDPFFYVTGGLYRITVTKGALTRVFRHVPLGTAAAFDAPPLVPMGEWDAETAYESNNVVRSAGSSYWALGPSMNVQPGVSEDWEVYWSLLAPGGQDGEDGEDGADGAAVPTSGLEFPEQSVAPSTPSAGTLKLYAKTDKYLYRKGSDGVERQLHDDPQLSSLIRQNSQNAAYTIVATDSGYDIFHPASDNNARTFTIPANASVAFPIGTVLCFTNMANTLTIAITSDTLTMLGSGASGSRTLAVYGMAVARKVAATQWVISGINLS